MAERGLLLMDVRTLSPVPSPRRSSIQTPPNGVRTRELTGRLAPSRLASTLAALAHRHGVPGAQLAVYHPAGATSVEFGAVEHGSTEPVGPYTAFPTGSITKAFTATLAMILVEDDDLELDAPVKEYLPELSGPGGRVTLRHLLSHTAGFPAGPDSDDVDQVSLRRYVLEHCRPKDLLLPPGTGFSYSNQGYVLVGHLIETITGMSWAEAMESIVLRPLGIGPAIVGGAGNRRRVAAGHSVNRATGRVLPVRQAIAPAEAPTGALAASARDLVALGRLHVGAGVPDLLPPSTAAEMRNPVPHASPFGLADGWGLGLATFRDDRTSWVGHDGNADGTACFLRIDPVEGWIVAFTSNANTGTAVWQDLQGVLADAGVPIGRSTTPRRSQRIPAPSDCAGRYVNGDMEFFVTTDGRGGLCLSVDGDAGVPLTLYADLAFAHPDPNTGERVTGGRFLRTGDRINGIQIGGRFAAKHVHPAR